MSKLNDFSFANSRLCDIESNAFERSNRADATVGHVFSWRFSKKNADYSGDFF